MREVAAFDGLVAAKPDVVYRRLREDLLAGGTLKIVMDDATTHELRGEGDWWFHGRWTVEAEGKGSRVRLRVYNKLSGIQAFASILPERQAVKDMKAKWPALLEALARKR
jgi:hypothetical protein